MVSIIIITIVFAINHYSKNVTMKYKTKEKDMFAKLENGEISKEEYVEWRKTQEPVYEHSSFEHPSSFTNEHSSPFVTGITTFDDWATNDIMDY